MGERDGFEVDRSAAEAWVAFQARLGDRLAAMGEDDVVVVEALVADEDEPGAPPYVQFCAWGDAMLRGEVASNHVLMEPRELDEEAERALEALGYDAPTYGPDDEADGGSLNFHADLPQGEADRLAVMSVRALRDVFGVAHPALLTGDLAEGASVPVEPAAVERSDEPVAAYPHGGHEELVALVDRALTPYFGHEPRHDDDGDIPVDLGDTVLFVRVHASVPVVELFACLATDVQDLERAAFEVNVLNRDVRFVKFRLAGDSILADLQLPAWPFAPEHLRAMVALMTETVQQVQDDLVARVRGRSVLGDDEPAADDEPAEADPDVDADVDAEVAEEPGGADGEADRRRGSGRRWRSAERVLAQLHAESPGSVTPEVAASVCGDDVDTILDLIAHEESQKVAWRRSRDEARAVGDVGGVEAGEAEVAYSRYTLSLLRRALRVVVERQAAREELVARPPASARRSRRHPTRLRRVPDPTLEEVDPEMWG